MTTPETLPQAVAAVTTEMQRMMPNATGDWCARLTAAMANVSTPVENPPAFPRTLDANEVDFIAPQVGMSLRDWLAGQALGGLFAHTSTPLGEEIVVCWSAADLMMAMRAK